MLDSLLAHVMQPLIGALGGVTVALIGVRTQTKKSQEEIQKAIGTKLEEFQGTQNEIKNEISVFKIKMDTLSNDVKKHNCLVERMYSAENKISVMEEKQRVANARIGDLERESHEKK